MPELNSVPVDIAYNFVGRPNMNIGNAIKVADPKSDDAEAQKQAPYWF